MIGSEFLQKIGEILQKSLSSEETYSAVFDILDDVLEFDSATLFVVNSDTGVLEVAESRGSQLVDLVPVVAFAKGEGLSGWVASQREPVVLPTLGDEMNKRGFRSLISIPLWSDDRLEGVLNIGHGESGFFRMEDKPDLKRIGIHLSLIVEQLRLRSELFNQNLILKKILADLSATQKALVEKERLAAIGQLVVRFNHEINNPLSIITSFISLLHDKYKNDFPEALEMLAKMKSAAERIEEVTGKLRELQICEDEEYLEGVKMLKID